MLRTPAAPRIVPARVFDAFGWCESDTLEWARARDRWDTAAPITSDNPPGLAFVLHGSADFLPTELARLHALGLGLEDERALAPWAIDDATDGLYEHRIRPREVLWLAANSLVALAWGLHDWAHFHNHGPFEERAWTELQCDATALAWLWLNRDAIEIDEPTWERARRDFSSLSRERFASESIELDEDLLAADRLKGMISRAA